MPLQGKKIFFANYVFYVSEGVYEPAEDSFFFAESLTVEEGDLVLDMGTGCGILGIVAADKARRVVAIDISPCAVRCAKRNAELNGVVDKMHFIEEDLFTALRIEERFDLILFNAPYLPVESKENDSWLGRAWAGGATGRRIIDRFIFGAPRYLKKNGAVLLMQSTLSNVQKTIQRFRGKGLQACVVAERDLPFFETLAIVKAEGSK
jgi:release factor glutamine methyltransferase